MKNNEYTYVKLKITQQTGKNYKFSVNQVKASKKKNEWKTDN